MMAPFAPLLIAALVLSGSIAAPADRAVWSGARIPDAPDAPLRIDASPAERLGVVEVAVDGVCSLSEAILFANGDYDVSDRDCHDLGLWIWDDALHYDLRDGTYVIDRRHGVPDATVLPVALPISATVSTAYLPAVIGRANLTALPALTGRIVIQNGSIVRPAGAPNLRLLEVAPGGELTLDGVSVAGGDTDVWFDDQPGGAVLVRPTGALTVTSSTLARNGASSGGAVAVDGGTLHVEGSWFVGNRAGGGRGGAIWLNGRSWPESRLTIASGGMSGNRAREGGGALALDGWSARAELAYVTIADNEVPMRPDGGASGGGVLVRDGSLDVSACRLSDNVADDGGGIAIREGAASIAGTSFERNIAWLGGALHAAGEADVTIVECDFERNVATTGGAIHNGSSFLTLVSSDLNANVAAGSGGEGGAIHHDNGRTRIQASTLRGNDASWTGGGIHAVGGGSVDIVLSTIWGNAAMLSGGVYTRRTDLMIDASTIADNVIRPEGFVEGSASGAGLFVDEPFDRDIVVRASLIANNLGDSDCYGHGVKSAGYNIDGDGTCGLRAAGDLWEIDPRLAPLALNGGLTPTLALLAGSPGLDRIPRGRAGCGTDLLRDQRGFPRPDPQSGKCDIGAVER